MTDHYKKIAKEIVERNSQRESGVCYHEQDGEESCYSGTLEEDIAEALAAIRVEAFEMGQIDAEGTFGMHMRATYNEVMEIIKEQDLGELTKNGVTLMYITLSNNVRRDSVIGRLTQDTERL